ncbi:unnamed protein product [Sphenostylis stenocarpa]|uniref:Uncharacterized protein n=1 Tax=Sphenostylis stenocarpa TaxID=92480 RepID=A0AA86W0R0_9FABA|nr:unnamed protein product [Sphenostylis stenocarpa]
MESKLPKEKPKSLALRRNLVRLQLELRNIIQGMQRNNGTWGFPRYGIGEEVDDQPEANGPESYKVFNYTDEEPVTEMKSPARGSKAELVPEPLLTPFILNESAPNFSGEGFSSKVSDLSQAKGYCIEMIEDLMELQQANQEENRMNFESFSLRLDEIEKKIQRDDD